MLFVTQQNKTSETMAVDYPSAFPDVPTVLVTPFWKGSAGPVGSVETVIGSFERDCEISGAGSGQDYFVNVLAYLPDATEASGFGNVGVRAASFPKTGGGGPVDIALSSPLASNEPVVLLTPRWSEGVVSWIETLFKNGPEEIGVFSDNCNETYAVNYLAADRGNSRFVESGTPFRVESGTYNKTGSGLYRVYFESSWPTPPIVFLSPWWNGTESQVGYIETLVDVTASYFEAVSANAEPNYFVNWMAVGVRALATVQGKLVTQEGQGIRNATISMTDRQGVVLTAVSSPFGVFTFQNVPADDAYVISVTSPNYSFNPQVLQVDGNMSGINIVATGRYDS